MMCGVPNTAFTEALAFVFQKRDLELLGYVNKSATGDEDYLTTLDIFWGCYEIMGVSLVDMRVWKWMYENPTATKEQLKDKVIEIAKDVWNTYYYPVFGTQDEPILAIYSHMISSPLYRWAYPLGHLIEFQLENYFKGKTLGAEVPCLFANGRLTPQWWMKRGLNTDLSVSAILEATTEANRQINK
jgi:oligoendopeptidase F